jgi:isopenicillin-N epimerase
MGTRPNRNLPHNHGSFGACLKAILEARRGWRDKLEAHPVRFLARDLEDLLDW